MSAYLRPKPDSGRPGRGPIPEFKSSGESTAPQLRKVACAAGGSLESLAFADQTQLLARLWSVPAGGATAPSGVHDCFAIPRPKIVCILANWNLQGPIGV